MHNYHTPLGFLNTYKYLISVCVCICVYQCWYHVALYLLSCDISVWKIIPTDKSVPGIHRSGTYKNLVQLSEFWNSHITRWTSTTYCKPLCKRGLSTFSKMPICRHFENYDSQAFVICHPIGETWLLLSNSFVQTLSHTQTPTFRAQVLSLLWVQPYPGRSDRSHNNRLQSVVKSKVQPTKLRTGMLQKCFS